MMSGRGVKLDFVQEHGHGGYDSEFSEDESEAETSNCQRTGKDATLLTKPFQKEKYARLAHKQVAAHEWDREEARNRRYHLIAMDAYARHKKYINDYLLYYGGSVEELKRSTVNDKTDLDVIKENHRFLWTEADETDMTWEKTLAKKYYDKLFKEYCIADLSRYKHNQFGFRWRVDKEVISGKGQFCCGNKHCDEKEGLKSWEVNFGYIEHGEKRNALVKLRLCPECSCKLNYHHRRKEVKAVKRKHGEEHNLDVPAAKQVKTTEKHFCESKGKSFTSKTGKDDNDSDQESEDKLDADDPSEAEYWKGPVQDAEDKTKYRTGFGESADELLTTEFQASDLRDFVTNVFYYTPWDRVCFLPSLHAALGFNEPLHSVDNPSTIATAVPNTGMNPTLPKETNKLDENYCGCCVPILKEIVFYIAKLLDLENREDEFDEYFEDMFL